MLHSGYATQLCSQLGCWLRGKRGFLATSALLPWSELFSEWQPGLWLCWLVWAGSALHTTQPGG